MPARPWIALTLVVAAACGGGSKSAPPPSRPQVVGQELTVNGRVTVVGSTPFEKVMVVAPGSGVELVGDLRDELRAASGAEVAVHGTIVAQGQMAVADYTIRSVAGRPPIVGILDAHADGSHYLRTEEGEEGWVLRLESVPEGLRGKAGAKVWVILGEGTRAVKAYGILREP